MDADFMIEKDRMGVITNKNHFLYFKDDKMVDNF